VVFLFTYLTRTSASEQERPRQKLVLENRCSRAVIWLTLIWFFDRNGEKLRYEISRDRSDGRYRLVITHPDGTESVEEIDQATDLIERSVKLMNNLRDDGWRVA
jgi:hypothetical protein